MSSRVPAGVATPDSMVVILTDVHILQASIQIGYFQGDTSNSVHKAFEDLWKKHHLSEETYNKSIQFYTYHPALLNLIYEQVLSNLSQQKAELLGKKHT